MTKRSLALALSCALVGAVFTAPVVSAASPSAATQLTRASAATVASTLGMSVDSAVAQKLMIFDSANGSYKVTQAGADALVAKMGVAGAVPASSLYAGLTTAELAALVAGGLALILVVASDEDASAAGTTSSSSSR